MSSEFRVLICQLTSIDSFEQNISQIESLIHGVPISEKIDLICLPENALYLRIVEGQKVPGLDLSHRVFTVLEEIARQRNCSIHIGSVPLQSGAKLVNASVLIEPGSKSKMSYEKIHLFDIELKGQRAIRESDVFRHGDHPSILNLNGWKIGQTICYDVRFSELFSRYAKEEVDLVLVPSSFLVETGRAHWEVLLRARAIESQCYVVASAQAGTHVGISGGERKTFGNSIAVDPWGTVLWQGSNDRLEAMLVTLSKSNVENVRRQIPMKSHRRLSR